VIPLHEINLSAGVVQTFEVLVRHFGPGYEWAVRIIASLLVLVVPASTCSSQTRFESIDRISPDSYGEQQCDLIAPKPLEF
jgi:hypothetical protein